MKIAYIILAHKNPLQVSRLISRLNYEDSLFVIHVDLNTDIYPFKNELSKYSNLYFTTKRYKTNWGGFNTVKATIELLKLAVENETETIVFISGQDYPIMSNNSLKQYLNNYNGKALIEYETGSLNKTLPNRTNRYYFADYFKYNKTGVFDYKKVPIIPRILTKILPKRNFLKGFVPFVGRVWFILPLNIAKYFVEKYNSNTTFNNFYKFTISSDEMYFQTLLLNSHFAENTINLQTTFADYNAPNPVIWKSKDLELLKKQTTPFARKFDTNIDEKILDLIDREILNA